jgi:hypothetical protein
MNQAICSSKITSGRQAEPRGRPGKDFDAVVPTGLCHGRTHHFGDLRSLKWSREITEGSLAHGRNDVSWSKFIGEDHEADVGTSTPDFAKKPNIFRDASFPPGDDQIEWLGPRKSGKMLIVNDALNAPAVAGEYLRKEFIEVAAGCHLERGLLCGRNNCTATGGRHRVIPPIRLARSSGSSGRCRVATWSEAGQSLGLIFKGWDSV